MLDLHPASHPPPSPSSSGVFKQPFHSEGKQQRWGSHCIIPPFFPFWLHQETWLRKRTRVPSRPHRGDQRGCRQLPAGPTCCFRSWLVSDGSFSRQPLWTNGPENRSTPRLNDWLRGPQTGGAPSRHVTAPLPLFTHQHLLR